MRATYRLLVLFLLPSAMYLAADNQIEVAWFALIAGILCLVGDSIEGVRRDVAALEIVVVDDRPKRPPRRRRR